MSEEDVTNIQAICAVPKQRAVELLEAASGIVSHAIEIHLQQGGNHQGQLGGDAVVAIEDTTDDELVEVTEMKEDEMKESAIPPKKKQRTATTKKPSATSTKRQNTKRKPGPKQNTLHSFLGIEKTESPAKRGQSTIHSFFTSRSANGSRGKAADSTTQVESKSESKSSETQDEKVLKAAVGISMGAEAINATAKQPTLKESKPNAAHSPKANTLTKPKKEEVQLEPVDPRLSYETLAKAFSEIVSTTKRNAKLNMLKTTIKGVIEALDGIHGDSTSRKQDAQTLTFALELICGKISLDGSDLVTPAPLQVSGAAVSSAIQLVTGGVSKSRLREAYRQSGDLGDVGAEFFSPRVSVQNFFLPRNKAAEDTTKEETATTTTSKSASIVQIHSLLQAVASVPKGTGSQKQRHNILVKLLRLSTTKDEMRFLVRILIGNMRLGATMKSILAGLAMAVQEIQTQETSTQDPAIQTVQKTFDICPRLNKLSLSLLCGGVEQMVKECGLEVGIPIQPSLANPSHSLEEVEKFMTKGASTEATANSVVAEWKYDGVRCQAHYYNSTMKLYSRHLIDNSEQYPDASGYMLEARKDGASVQTFIIDAEIVGVARNKKDDDWRLLPFQILSTRRGTKNADSNSLVQIRVFAFDLMYLNGESLISKSLWERQKLLKESFKETDGFTFASSKEFGIFDEQKITAYLQEAVKGGAEGLMMKLTGRASSDRTNGQEMEVVPRPLPTPYESGNRSTTWLKLKRDYVSGFADTLDVVPIGAWYGNGRKAEKGFLSPILFAIYDEDDGVFRSISRCMSFTDDMYTAIREFYFHGTPYPAGVGLSGGETGKSKAKGLKESSAEEEAKGDDSSSEADRDVDQVAEEENSEEDDDDDDKNKFVGVNCFPVRPSASVYVTNESPSIWFQPKEVWEVSFADLTLSRTHTAAAGLVEDAECRGVALRFPRFKRRRPDKSVEQATTSAQIAQLFSKQFKQG